MDNGKKDSGLLEMAAAIAILLLLWKMFCKGRKTATTIEMEKPCGDCAKKQGDELSGDPNFNLNEYCDKVVYRPLSSVDLVPSNLLGRGWCYRGDRSVVDTSKGFGDSYADKQAEDYAEMKQKEAMLINNKLCIQFKLVNTGASQITTDIFNTTQDVAVIDGTDEGGGPVPSKVTVLPITLITDDSFTLNWELLATALGYCVDIATDISFLVLLPTYNNLDVGNVSTLDVSGLTPGLTYYCRIRGYNEIGAGYNSETIAVSTIPDAPIATDASDRDYDNFIANWDPSVGATGYFIDVATDSGFTLMLPGYNNRNIGNVESILIEGLVSETTYYYRVRAYNTSGISANSNIISTITMTDFQDYWLPSIDELKAMYDELKDYGVGGFSLAPLDCFYASSSEVDATKYWGVQFSDGIVPPYNKSNLNHRIRPCRKFTSSIVYALRDTGQAGGLIFHIIDNGDSTYDYYEAAPNDLKPDIKWSNIDSTEIGVSAQGTGIGDGEDNTTAIVNQVSHTDSFAKSSLDLIITN
jgi:hypothetical protein